MIPEEQSNRGLVMASLGHAEKNDAVVHWHPLSLFFGQVTSHEPPKKCPFYKGH